MKTINCSIVSGLPSYVCSMKKHKNRLKRRSLELIIAVISVTKLIIAVITAIESIIGVILVSK